jgi:hypothetical protein
VPQQAVRLLISNPAARKVRFMSDLIPIFFYTYSVPVPFERCVVSEVESNLSGPDPARNDISNHQGRREQRNGSRPIPPVPSSLAITASRSHKAVFGPILAICLSHAEKRFFRPASLFVAPQVDRPVFIVKMVCPHDIVYHAKASWS